jgi:hypothetical protein
MSTPRSVAVTVIALAFVGVLVFASSAQDRPTPAGSAAAPVVVELFTSEGCSSCPPADRLLAAYASQPDVIALGEHVDYWDDLGWKDRFSSAAVTDRQRVYAASFGIGSIYTPEMVIDGRAEAIGSDDGAVRRAIAQAARAPHGRVQIGVEASGRDALAVSVEAAELPVPGRGDHDEAVVAITEDRLSTDVRRGENHGRVLAHTAVVRALTVLPRPTAAGAALHAAGRLTLGADWKRENLKIVAFVQEARARRIVAAAARPLADARP